MPKLVRSSAIWIVFVAVILIAPQIFDSRSGVSILNDMAILIIFALSYNMLLGQTGMLSFGHAVYFGLGGFVTVHMLNYVESEMFSIATPLVPLFGGITGLFFAFIIGSFSTKRSGTVFAMISLGIGEMIAACSLIFVAFFGGEGGVSGDRTYGPEWFGINFAQEIEVYYVIAFWLIVSTVLMYLYTQTPVGRIANAVRDNPERAEFVGYNQQRVRFIAFCVSGFFAGIAGGLFAINYEILTEENLKLSESGAVLLMAYIGGLGFFIGPIVGAILLTLLSSVIGNYTDLWQLYLGLLFVITVLYMPSGISGVIMKHHQAFKIGRLNALYRPYALIFIPFIVLILSVTGLMELITHAREAMADDLVMSLYFVEFNSHAVMPWVVLIGLSLVSGILVKYLKGSVMEEWENINSDFVSEGRS